MTRAPALEPSLSSWWERLQFLGPVLCGELVQEAGYVSTVACPLSYLSHEAVSTMRGGLFLFCLPPSMVQSAWHLVGN